MSGAAGGGALDRTEMMNAFHRYPLAQDQRDVELLASTITEDFTMVYVGLDGAIERTIEGRDTFIAGYRRAWADVSGLPPQRHLITNVIVEHETADEAQLRCYQTVIKSIDATPVLIGMNWTETLMVKQAGRWLLQRRTTTREGLIP